MTGEENRRLIFEASVRLYELAVTDTRNAVRLSPSVGYWSKP